MSFQRFIILGCILYNSLAIAATAPRLDEGLPLMRHHTYGTAEFSPLYPPEVQAVIDSSVFKSKYDDLLITLPPKLITDFKAFEEKCNTTFRPYAMRDDLPRLAEAGHPIAKEMTADLIIDEIASDSTVERLELAITSLSNGRSRASEEAALLKNCVRTMIGDCSRNSKYSQAALIYEEAMKAYKASTATHQHLWEMNQIAIGSARGSCYCLWAKICGCSGLITAAATYIAISVLPHSS